MLVCVQQIANKKKIRLITVNEFHSRIAHIFEFKNRHNKNEIYYMLIKIMTKQIQRFRCHNYMKWFYYRHLISFYVYTYTLIVYQIYTYIFHKLNCHQSINPHIIMMMYRYNCVQLKVCNQRYAYTIQCIRIHKNSN